ASLADAVCQIGSPDRIGQRAALRGLLLCRAGGRESVVAGRLALLARPAIGIAGIAELIAAARVAAHAAPGLARFERAVRGDDGGPAASIGGRAVVAPSGALEVGACSAVRTSGALGRAATPLYASGAGSARAATAAAAIVAADFAGAGRHAGRHGEADPALAPRVRRTRSAGPAAAIGAADPRSAGRNTIPERRRGFTAAGNEEGDERSEAPAHSRSNCNRHTRTAGHQPPSECASLTASVRYARGDLSPAAAARSRTLIDMAAAPGGLVGCESSTPAVIIAPMTRVFGRDWTEESVLADGRKVVVRVLRPEDAPLLAKGFEQLSPESRFRRFHGARGPLTADELRYLTGMDGEAHFALGAVDATSGEGLGVGRFVRVAGEPTVAEPAVAIVDAAQRKGLGRFLLA